MTEVEGPVLAKTPDPSLVSKWEAFLLETNYKQGVQAIADGYPDIRSMTIQFGDIDRYDADLASSLLDHPNDVLSAAAESAKNMMSSDLRHADIYIRVNKLPRDARVAIKELKGRTLGKLVSFEALVTRATQPKNDLRIGHFRCERCGHVIKQQMEAQMYSEPMECYKDQDGCGRASGSTRFRFLATESKTIDSQKIECQEPLENNRGGTSPARMTVWVSAEQAGTVNAGSRIIVNGIPKMVKGADKPRSSIMETDVDAVSIELTSQEYDDIEISPEEEQVIKQMSKDPALFDKLVASIAPSIKGYDQEKAGMLLQLFGGVPKALDDGSRMRGDIHILLIGDPGVAKSAMVRYMCKLAPHGVFASGKSSSAAGLTCAATKDAEWGEGRWTLEAGAMVMADQGYLGVDELDKMREEDRSSMHEGMESQSISVHKAGIDATLPTRCPMLAAANPKYGRFEEQKSLVDQIELEDTLLSRFDLIFVIQDRPNAERDSEIAEHILRAHARGGALANRGEAGMDSILAGTSSVAPIFQAEMVRKYVSFAKRIRPVLTTEAMNAIRDQYVGIRKLGEGEDRTVPITARQLEGYIRMSEAAARMRLSRWVEAEDAQRAIELVEYALTRLSGSGGSRDIDQIMSIPKGDRMKRINILDLIRNAGHDGLSITELCEIADSKLKMNESEVNDTVEKLKRNGDVTEPSLGHVRVVL